jgi:hypothetical protein
MNPIWARIPLIGRLLARLDRTRRESAHALLEGDAVIHERDAKRLVPSPACKGATCRAPPCSSVHSDRRQFQLPSWPSDARRLPWRGR